MRMHMPAPAYLRLGCAFEKDCPLRPTWYTSMISAKRADWLLLDDLLEDILRSLAAVPVGRPPDGLPGVCEYRASTQCVVTVERSASEFNLPRAC